jgi:beta propeller repeat protein
MRGKIMRSILAILLGLCIMIPGSVAFAEVAVTQVTSNAYEDTLPRIKGNYVVWQAYVDGDWDIFLYNIETGETTRINDDNDYDDVMAQTDGTHVVWRGYTDGEWDIFLWDGTQILTISDRDADDMSPHIADGLVVWASEPFGEGFTGPETILVYDINTMTTIEDPDYIWQDRGYVDGNLRVTTRHDGQDREIFLYNAAANRYHQITDNAIDDLYPSISNNYIAWMAGGEIWLAECTSLVLISPKNNTVLAKKEIPTFNWEHIGYSEFQPEFSRDPGFPKADTLTLPKGNWLSETSFVPTEEDWEAIRAIGQRNGSVHWRVEGVRSDGSVSYSETWSFTIKEFEDVATGITNEDTGGSGGGPCFISTAAFN